MFNVNEYFDGNVTSIGFQTATLPATVGVMAVGEYEFATQQKEVMTVVSGGLEANLPGEASWQSFGEGESFEVGANTSFQVKVIVQTAYLCTYE